MSIRIAVGQFHELTEEKLRFAAQIGATGLQMNNPTLPGETRWEEKDVRALVDKTESYGLKFEAIENVPTHFYEQGDAGAAGPRRADRELHRDDRARSPGPACRCSAITSCRTPSGARSGGAERVAARSRRKFDMAAVEAVSPRRCGDEGNSCRRRLAASRRCRCSARADRSSRKRRCGPTTNTSSKQCCRPPRKRASARAPSRRSARADAGRRGAALLPAMEGFKHAYELAEPARPGPSTFVSAAAPKCRAARASVHEMIEYFAPKGASPTSTSAT